MISLERQVKKSYLEKQSSRVTILYREAADGESRQESSGEHGLGMICRGDI